MSKIDPIAISRSVIGDAPTDKLERAREFLNRLQELRGLEKLQSTYIDGVGKAVEYNKHNKVYYDFRFDGTVTGRLSCAAYSARENMGVSFHTLPRTKDPNIRSLFVAPKDHYFIAADYSAMELRILAHACRDKNLINAFFSGQDLHKYTASLIWKKPIDQITPEERQIAKSVSFLIVYGGSEFKLSKTVNIEIDEAKEIIDTYASVYPGVFTWMSEVKEFINKNKYAKSIFGRRRNLDNIKSPIPKIRSRCERQGVNFIIQSSASEITTFALLDMAMEFKKQGMESRVVASVHDSIEVISPKDEIDEALMILNHKMTQYPYLRQAMGFDCVVPLAIEVEVGSSFGGGVDVKFNKSGGVSNLREVKNAIGQS
jgi:DNA polymerase-1